MFTGPTPWSAPDATWPDADHEARLRLPQKAREENKGFRDDHPMPRVPSVCRLAMLRALRAAFAALRPWRAELLVPLDGVVRGPLPASHGDIDPYFPAGPLHVFAAPFAIVQHGIPQASEQSHD